MFKMNRRATLKASAAALASTALPKLSKADSVSYEQPGSYTAADLGGVLTPMGGLKAGNADGTIPAWTGGYSTVPEGYQSGNPRPAPFADEKPVVVITSSNLAQYASKLSIGAQGLFKKYPDYTIQVFPTHRTAIAPQWVYDYIAKNAANAKLLNDGNAISGAYGGIPFPIPQNGHELMWNHLLAWNGTTARSLSDNHTVTASGEIIFETRVDGYVQSPYYFQNGEASFNGLYLQLYANSIAPPDNAGLSVLQLSPVNPNLTQVKTFAYLSGERRVRQLPEAQFDTPGADTGGVVNYDEISVFSGRLIEYDFKYLGIREIYVPYNSNKMLNATPKDQLGPHFLNPDLLRWELHRCRVVEATLKPGFRNVDARRTFYCDEDTGAAILADVYDANGSLWKHMHLLPVAYPDVPCVQVYSNFTLYDLHSGIYTFQDHQDSEIQPQWKIIPQLPDSFFTPAKLAGEGGIG